MTSMKKMSPVNQAAELGDWLHIYIGVDAR